MFLSKEWLSSTRYKQLIASISITLSLAVTGMYLSWGSPTVPLLTGEQGGLDFKLTSEEASWVVSGYTLGLLAGNILVSFPTERFGRRITLLFAAPLLFLSWVGLTSFKNYILLTLSRAIGGFAASSVFLCCSLYIGEIADKDLRGRLGSVFSVLKLSGNLYVLSVGPFVSYYVLAWTCSALPIIFFVILLFLPESPYFHIKKGNLEKAKESLEWFAPNNVTKQELDEKLKHIQAGVEKDMTNKGSFKDLFTIKTHRRALVAILGLKVLQQLSGVTAIESYMETIVEESGSSISGNVSSVLFGIVQVLGVLASTTLIDRFGRKPLLMLSAFGCAICLIAEGVYFYLDRVVEANVDSLSWLPTTGITLYLFLTSAGIYTIPYIYLGEIFATDIKEVAGAVGSFFGSVFSFTVTRTYSPLSEAFGLYTVFWAFAVVCLGGMVFVYFFVPETKNKSLEDIQIKLAKSRKPKQVILEEGNLEKKPKVSVNDEQK